MLLWAAFPLLGAAPARSAEAFSYHAYARVLERYVTPDGQVRYAELKKDRGDLNAFLSRLAAASPENRPELFPTREAQMAYWINAYNAFVLAGAVERYPLKSVVSVETAFGALFFKRARYVAGGRKVGLDDIEHGILRARYRDPRIHFAVNCASASCPRLRAEPFWAETLDAQLEDAAREFINREENVRMRGDVLFLSAIFNWYQEDFLAAVPAGNHPATVVDYVLRYLPEATAERIRREQPRVEFYPYDWALNDAAARAD